MFIIMYEVGICACNRAHVNKSIFRFMPASKYFNFRVATKSCTGCQEFLKLTEDIPGEVDMHIIYLGTIFFVFVLIIAEQQSCFVHFR